jgi:K+-sensing histidine kinase KdpD
MEPTLDTTGALGEQNIRFVADEQKTKRGSAEFLSRGSGVAVVLVGVALVSTLLVQRLFPYPFLFLFFAAVMASAWIGGTVPGLLAVILSTLAIDYFFVPPFHSLAVNATDGAYFAAFVACSLVASWVSASRKKMEKALRDARDRLEVRVAERTSELEKSIAEWRATEAERARLEAENSQLSTKLETRKLVERAKSILQRELKITEEEAYRRMQRESQERRKSMREISEAVILNDDMRRSSR